MKKILFAFVTGCIPALAIINEAHAQYANSITALQPAKDVIKMDNLSAFDKHNTVSLAAINIKAMKDFKKSYKLVSSEKWYKVSDGFRAYFNSAGSKNFIYYDKKGRWTGSLKNYTEDKLPKDIRSIVKRVYYDFTITSVDEVETAATKDKPVYIVHLEDNDSIKLVKVNDEGMDVYQEFAKDKSGK